MYRDDRWEKGMYADDLVKFRCNSCGDEFIVGSPRCGKFIVGSYETDKKRGGGISQKLNGCSNCLQSIDFSEWQKKESDDLVLED